MSEFALSAFATLIVILDPIGLIPVFLSLTTGMSASARRQVSILACTMAALIMSAFALVGAGLLAQLGITLAAFRIAGGLLLFYTAFEMVFDLGRTRRRAATGETAEPKGAPSSLEARRIAAFPIAVPLLAGPGAITACILLAGQAGETLAARAELLGVIIVSCALCFVFFLSAGPIDRLLGDTGKIVLTRLLGVLLAALAVQFVADGILEIAAKA